MIDDSYESTEEWSYKESIARQDSIDNEDSKYELTVYQNVIAALKAGATQVSRSGKQYRLNDAITDGMNSKEIELEAKIMASFIVG